MSHDTHQSSLARAVVLAASVASLLGCTGNGEPPPLAERPYAGSAGAADAGGGGRDAENSPPGLGGSGGGKNRTVLAGGHASYGSPTAGGEAGASSAPGGAGASQTSASGSTSDGGVSASSTATCLLTYRQGHGDLYASSSATLRLEVRATFEGMAAETPAEPSRVCIEVPQASYALSESIGGTPDSSSYSFLGLPPKVSFWYLPQSPREGMPWLGVSTEGILSATYDSDTVLYEVTEAEVPDGANVAAWFTGTLGAPSLIFSLSEGKLSYAFPVGAHLHMNWAFTKPGTYVVKVQIRGSREGVWESSPVAPLTFVVRP